MVVFVQICASLSIKVQECVLCSLFRVQNALALGYAPISSGVLQLTSKCRRHWMIHIEFLHSEFPLRTLLW